MSVIPFGAPARARGRTVVAAATATALTAAVLGLPLSAAASPSIQSSQHSAMTAVTVFDDDWDADGTVDVRSTATSVYGSDGRLLSDGWEVDNGVDGTIDWAQRQTLTYDDDGRVVLTVFEDFTGPDPIADRRVTIESGTTPRDDSSFRRRASTRTRTGPPIR